VPPPLRAVVVHRNRPAAALRTAGRLVEEGAGKVVLVDSGSRPADLDALRAGARQLGAQVVATGANVGFGPGANAGLRPWLEDAAGEPYALVAPHDATPERGCVASILEQLERRPAAAMASAEFGPGEDFKPTVDKFFGGSFVPTTRGHGWESVDYPHGTLLVLRRQAMQQIGLFDERFFAYCEEADLGIRARRAGWDVGLVWGAVVANGRPPRADVSRYLQLRNTLLLLEKHFGLGTVLPRLVYELVGLVTDRPGPTLGVGLGLDHRDEALERRAVRRATRQALADYVRRRFGPVPGEALLPEAAPV